MWANYSTFSAFSPLSSAEKLKEKSEHLCLYLRNSSSDASLLLQIRAGETRLLLLQFANRESVQTDCAVIFVHQQVFGWNEFSSDFEEQNHEQKDAVQQLFESNGWPWTVEVTDVCKTESTAHFSWLDNILRSQPLALPLNWRPRFPLPDSRGSESAECEFCFCVPCVTTSRQSWLGTGQSAH